MPTLKSLAVYPSCGKEEWGGVSCRSHLGMEPSRRLTPLVGILLCRILFCTGRSTFLINPITPVQSDPEPVKCWGLATWLELPPHPPFLLVFLT